MSGVKIPQKIVGRTAKKTSDDPKQILRDEAKRTKLASYGIRLQLRLYCTQKYGEIQL